MENNVDIETDYKVADIDLHQFGRKEILLAEQEMPGMMETTLMILVILTALAQMMRKTNDIQIWSPHFSENMYVSHISNLAAATGHGLKKGNLHSCTIKGK